MNKDFWKGRNLSRRSVLHFPASTALATSRLLTQSMFSIQFPIKCFPLKLQWGERPSSKSLQIINAREGVEKGESSYTVGENVHWNSHYAEWYGGYLRKLKTELPQDSVTLLLGIYLEKTNAKRSCTLMFTAAALFTTWRQPLCPSTGGWIKKMWYTQTYIYLYTNTLTQQKIYMCIYIYIYIMEDVRERYIYVYTHTYTYNGILLIVCLVKSGQLSTYEGQLSNVN